VIPARFGDKYILLDQIGSGGVAEVFRGKLTGEQGFEKLIVIKKLLPEHSANREMVDIFISEARLAALLQHENIAATYDFGELDGEYFIAMEYLFGKNLYAVMARARDCRGLFGAAHALAVCSRICEGMEYAHNLTDLQNKPLNLVHRDLTPHNIFITYDGKVKILDFGVAKAELFDNKTREGVVKGKISYMSPERLSGEEIDSRSDIFSIGILLYEMLGRTRMYQGDTAELIRKCLTADFQDLREIEPDLDPRIHEILDKALAVEISKRYQFCAEMQADMDDLLFDMGHRADSRFIKDSIQELFAQEHETEQGMVATLFTDFDEAKLPKRDKTDISIPRRYGVEEDTDRTMVLAFEPALQLLKSRTAAVNDWSRRMLDTARAAAGDAQIDKRYIWGGAGAAGFVVLLLLVALFSGGDEDAVDSTVLEDRAPAVKVKVVEVVEPLEKRIEETVESEAGEPESADVEAPVQPELTAAPAVLPAPPVPAAPAETVTAAVSPQAIPPETAKVPVLKKREMKIKKQQAEPPARKVPEQTVAIAFPPTPRGMEPESAPPVAVAGQTMSFAEEAADHTKRRNILMLHTRAEEAMRQGRLLEPAKSSAHTYYRQILELDPRDNRAKDGLRLIGDKYAAVAETALAEKQFDRAASHTANGLKVMPEYPRLLVIDERIKRERADYINNLSQKARACIDNRRLSTPVDDSAYFYYSEILRIDPDSELARKGFRKIADTYAALADTAFLEFNYAEAEKLVRRGLQVVPNHYYLQSLQQELERGDLERVGHSMKKRINKLFSE